VGSPNGSRPVQPTVHRPKVNLSAGLGVSEFKLSLPVPARDPALAGHKLLINAKNKLISRRGFWEAG
jgi:hypothetical protein